MKRRIGNVNLSNSVIPLLRENIHFLKGSSLAELENMTKHMSRVASVLGSPVWYHVSEDLCLG
jgi:hypothetical protein